MKNRTHLSRLLVLFLFAASVGFANAQTVVPAIVVDGDTMPYFRLKAVRITGKLGQDERRRILSNTRLVYNIKKVMPYAQACASKINEVNEHLSTLSTDKEKRRYMKSAEKELKAEYEDDLRKMSFTQGKLLIKLIDRQCGSSSYELIQLYKSGRSAFLWNGVAGIFGMNLKEDYDPKEEQEIEVVLDYLGYK